MIINDDKYGGFYICGECMQTVKNGEKCDHKIRKYKDEMPKIKTTKSIIAETIATRDKWWIDRLNEEHIVIRLTENQEEFSPGDYIAMSLERWQQLKKETE